MDKGLASSINGIRAVNVVDFLLERERKESQERLERVRIESQRTIRAYTRWLVATFMAAFIAMIGVFVNLLVSSGYLLL